MTGDSFLSRWSRLKRGAREEAERRVPDVAVEEAAKAPPAEAEAEVPIEELPPVDTIGPDTDLTAWLKRKVPESWKQAALRRLWSADPAIRDFVGPADYAWDWNTPGGMPGYGPLGASDDVEKLLARAMGLDEGALQPLTAAAPPPPCDEPSQAVAAQGVEAPLQAVAMQQETASQGAVVRSGEDAGGSEQAVPTGVAAQAPEAGADDALRDEPATPPAARPLPMRGRRRGGSAMPV
ncbi:DUF3306 domain-containing protein [Chelatococcus sp. SYSU_G07232]|uniref:DUF3306 domain-containing protein n=1 Tax=Chelatococcus albus TaxID=3047466 RepID=A0ABT7AJR0_9HYPH|nr:DUF3306 domain-containing protein [Chelatococcus sp. SYSU_G07232]MDJ1159616.1 DUF3306 domain-containing protein [Chelatococcus sp. SYSU_G07232]